MLLCVWWVIVSQHQAEGNAYWRLILADWSLSIFHFNFRNKYTHGVFIESLTATLICNNEANFGSKPQTDGNQNVLCGLWRIFKRHKLSFQGFWTCSKAGNHSTSWHDIILKFSKCFDYRKSNSSAPSLGKLETV